jgi:hypothetical protein
MTCYDLEESRGRGYDFDAGMSNNALDAYERGVKPLSKITCEDLKTAGWKSTKTFALFLAKHHFWISTEWHHSGGSWFNEVRFFSPQNIVEKWNKLAANEQSEWQVRFEVERKETKIIGQPVEGYYTIWGGSRRRPRRIGEQPFTGILTGDWIHLDGGRKKKASSRHLFYKLV